MSYPTAFNEDGSVPTSGWTTYSGDSKGKFEDFVALLGSILGTFHEDGKICSDWAGTTATYSEINSGNFTYFAKNGYRAKFDDLVRTIVALNETKKTGTGASAGNIQPAYNLNAITNILVDHNKATSITVPGSRLGIIPALMESKYLNVNYMKGIQDSIEETISNIIQNYFKNDGKFLLTDTGSGDLESYYLCYDTGTLDEGYTTKEDCEGAGLTWEINHTLDWDKSINKLRYFSDNYSLEQLERSLDLIVDFSKDARFIAFLKQGVPAIDNYIIIKYIDEHDGINTRAEAIAADCWYIAKNCGTSNCATEIQDGIDFLADFEYKDFLDLIKDMGINDIEKFYNFKLDNWTDSVDPEKIQSNFDELNAKLNKYFSINVKEGLVEGIYKIISNAPTEFKNGDTVYGYGKYVECDQGDTGWFEDDGKYYRYIDRSAWIIANKDTADIEVQFEGLKKYMGFRSDTATDYTYSCEEYVDRWFRNGDVKCPNIYNGHKYDLRMDWAMNAWNDKILTLIAADFSYGQTVDSYAFGKTGQNTYTIPTTFIDGLFGWNGSAYNGVNFPDSLNYFKDKILDEIYDDTEINVSDFIDFLGLENGDPGFNFAEETASLRIIITKFHETLYNELFEYEFEIAGTLYDEVYEINETAAPVSHKHVLNNIAEVISIILNPDSADYQTGNLFNSWTDFLQYAREGGDEGLDSIITVETLDAVKTEIGDLLYNGDYLNFSTPLFMYEYDTDNHSYSPFMDNILVHYDGDPLAPAAIDQHYDVLLKIATILFEEDGLAEYLFDNVSGVDATELFNELNILMDNDYFDIRDPLVTDENTFWWITEDLINEIVTYIENHD